MYVCNLVLVGKIHNSEEANVKEKTCINTYKSKHNKKHASTPYFGEEGTATVST